VCEPRRCPHATARRNEAIAPSWLSTFGLALGAAGVGAGIYLIATAGGASPVTVTTGGVEVTPMLGPGSVGLNGTF
jgi:hypothetical protein